MPPRAPRDQFRFGIGEWYGHLFHLLTAQQRKDFADIQSLPRQRRPPQICPFQSRPQRTVMCGKPGGVCTLRLYKAVYFSGEEMGADFREIQHNPSPDLPFPSKARRPDYRSSGPKRLMPQLQVKVPTLRRWGKRMAVVVDVSFFQALGEMDNVDDISNCDIVWFTVCFNEGDGRAKLGPASVYRTTLERAVEGLTAGVPVGLGTFEERIRAKLTASRRTQARRSGGPPLNSPEPI